MPHNMRIVRLIQVRLTRAQAHRLIEPYGCGDVPREDALERLTEAAVTVYDAPRGDRVELDVDASGEPVNWLDQDEIDRLIFDTESPRRGGAIATLATHQADQSRQSTGAGTRRPVDTRQPCCSEPGRFRASWRITAMWPFH